MSNIYLIGMPGCGKSTLGKAVAEQLNMTFVDTDSLIVSKEQTTIPVIFETKGEKYFRTVETECVRETSNRTGMVVATGGGVPVKEENVRVMKSAGKVVFIDVDLENLKERMIFGDRPLLSGDGIAKLEKLYAERYEKYKNAADVVLKCDNGDRENNISKLVKLLEDRHNQ